MLMVAFSSCDAILEQDKTDFGKGPVLTQFTKKSVSANFIKDGTTQTYNIPVSTVGGTNLPLDKAITVTISVDPSSTAVSGTQFTLETTTVTIPAGEMSANAQIKVITNNLDPLNAKKVVLKIDSSSQGVSESNKTSVVLQAVCSLNLAGFVGNYTATSGGVASAAVVSLGAEANTLAITNGSKKFLIKLSPDILKPTFGFVPKGAVESINATYGDVWATTIEEGSSTYNSCTFALNLKYKRCVSAGCFAGETIITMVKS